MNGTANSGSSDFDWTRCNRTELYQICRKAELPVHPGLSKEQLIHVLTVSPVAQPPHPIDPLRNGIMGFLIDHRSIVESLLTCPAKSMNPKACFQCVDTQVVSCLVSNREHEALIQLRRKP